MVEARPDSLWTGLFRCCFYEHPINLATDASDVTTINSCREMTGHIPSCLVTRVLCRLQIRTMPLLALASRLTDVDGSWILWIARVFGDFGRLFAVASEQSSSSSSFNIRRGLGYRVRTPEFSVMRIVPYLVFKSALGNRHRRPERLFPYLTFNFPPLVLLSYTTHRRPASSLLY